MEFIFFKFWAFSGDFGFIFFGFMRGGEDEDYDYHSSLLSLSYIKGQEINIDILFKGFVHIFKKK